MSAALARAFARGIRAERSRAGLTMRQLAERLSWSESTLQAIETGTRRLPAEDLGDICRALGVPLARLLIDAPPEDLAALGLRTG